MLVATENMDVLQQNGFELQIDEAATAGQGPKLKVTAFPVSKSTEFGMTGMRGPCSCGDTSLIVRQIWKS